MAKWETFPIDRALFTNADETIISKANAALENLYQNEADGQSRFPGRIPFSVLSGTKTYLSTFRGNLIAGTDEGKIFRIAQSGAAEDVTGVPVSGGRRMVFDRTTDELLIAAGGPLIRLARDRTEILSRDAPDSTHVGYVDGYVLAIEPYSGRFFHSEAGLYRTWNPIDVLTAEAKPDPLIALVVTPFRELLLAGDESVEQFESVAGNPPFARRWTNGDGLLAPYTMIATDDGVFGVNPQREFVRFNQQITIPEGNAIGLSLERIDNWDDAWSAQIHIKGQKFILLQAPHATNLYGSAGVTLLFDYRAGTWSNLYDWDEDSGVPLRWLPWSYETNWGRHFVGVPGGVMELTPEAFAVKGLDGSDQIQRCLVRSGHVDKFGPSDIDRVRLRLKRGTTSPASAKDSRVGIRVNRDNRGFSKWQFKSLGRYGERQLVIEFGSMGQATTWQFEIMITDPVPMEVVNLKVFIEGLAW